MNDQSTKNKDAISSNGMAATSHPLATEEAVKILKKGGNAIDAAVASAFVLSVVEPSMSGIGGRLQAIIKLPNGEVRGVDASTQVPENYDSETHPKNSYGYSTIGIPGVVAGLVKLNKEYGKLSLKEVMEDAIYHAENGYHILPGESFRQKFAKDIIKDFSGTKKYFLKKDGENYNPGELMIQKDLAEILKHISDRGRDGFYKGEVARKLLEGVQRDGGIWSEEDLASYKIIEREPLVGSYRDVTIVSAPPPSAGGVALINMFNMLSGYDIKGASTVTRVHLLVEIMRRAYRDRGQYLGDPDFIDMPLDMLLHPFYAVGQRANLRLDQATPSTSLPGVQPIQLAGGNQTSHFSILDMDGNIVAATQSINFSYGSKYMAAGTGVLLNNEMDDFSKKPGEPNGYQLLGSDANSIQPGKRMLSSMTPTILRSREGAAILGSPGGSQIITMVFLSGLSWIEGSDANEMAGQSRFHHQYFPDRIFFEDASLTGAERAALESMGHRLELNQRTVGNGNLQIVTWNRVTNAVQAASDPRGIGEPRYYEP